jgi:hypothetical protein
MDDIISPHVRAIADLYKLTPEERERVAQYERDQWSILKAQFDALQNEPRPLVSWVAYKERE